MMVNSESRLRAVNSMQLLISLFAYKLQTFFLDLFPPMCLPCTHL